jgi:hypothetical protein
MSDKNLEQRINIKFCVKIGKRASETLALLPVVLVNTSRRKRVILNGRGGTRKGEMYNCLTCNTTEQL